MIINEFSIVTYHGKCNTLKEILSKMSIILGAVLFLGVVAYAYPFLKNYCHQTSDNPEEIPIQKNEEQEEIIDKDLPMKNKSNVIKLTKLKETTVEKEIKEEQRMNEKKTSSEEKRIKRKEGCHLEKEFSKINEKDTIDVDEIVEDKEKEIDNDDDEDDDIEREDADRTVRRRSSLLSNIIIKNNISPNKISQPITVQAVVHENKRMVILQQPLSNESPLIPKNNSKIDSFLKKKHNIGRKVKKFFTRSERKKTRSPIEESGSSSDYPRNHSISEIHSTPTNIVNQHHPLANSTILNSQQPGNMNFQFRSPNGILSVYTQASNGRINSPDDSGFRSSIETSTIYKDLPNERNNSILLPLPNNSNEGNCTIFSIVMGISNNSSGESRK
ncbi:uncharacterized ENTR1 family protein-like [Leptopilina heterotoma]|uniref:uncharacterized ENTR1 family protein-like n=1 Tax=Leptopilina heterotoma TaxID=63436 RepID=UPI001CA98EA0|nr:uncharacterized ENTR1 family protein-like [Leptopilina heterotoma]